MELVLALREYQTVYLPSRNYAARTREHYKREVTELVTYLSEQGIRNNKELGLAHLNGFLAHLDGKGLTGVTRRRYTFAIRSFLAFLEQHGHIRNDLTKDLIPPHTEEHTPRVLTTEEYKRLQLAVANNPRNAAIIELLLQTGIRLSELARLTLADIQLPTKINQEPGNTGALTIRQGKGRKDRTLSLNYKACRALKTYLQVRPKTDLPALFISKFKTPITPRGYEWIVKQYLTAAKIPNASVHALRHTFGTHMAKNGANLKTIQEMMGHADLKTTSRYVSLARDLMDKDVQAHAL
jgi:site-specific recombinase XerD